MTDLVAAVIATLVACAFGFSTFEYFLQRGRRQYLAWSIALSMFALASGALAVGAADGWASATFRVFFLFGAIANVPVLALGTLYLLTPLKIANWSAGACAVYCAFSAGVIAVTPFTHRLPHQQLAQASQVLPASCTVLAAIGSGIGTIVIVVGAIYSIVRRRDGRLIAANVLIAAGTLVTGASGIANSVFDKMTAFSVSLGLGITIIFIGFLVAAPPITSRREHVLAVDAASAIPLR